MIECRWLDIFLDRYCWFRRWRGGKWERWWIDVAHFWCWIRVAEFTRITGQRPWGLCRSMPTEEDWG